MAGLDSKQLEKMAATAGRTLKARDEQIKRYGGAPVVAARRREGRGVRALAWIGGGSIAVLACVGGLTLYKEKVRNSDEAHVAADTLCGVADAAARAVSSSACVVEVVSQVPIKPRNPEDDGVTGAVKFVLSGDTKIGAVQGDRQGAALYVHVDAVATDRYQDTYNASKNGDIEEGDDIGAAQYFSAYYPAVAAGGEAGSFALEQCRADVSSLLSAVKTNADIFAEGDFDQSAIRASLHTNNYAPYTPTPMPATEHTEIIFTSTTGDGVERELICPQTGI